MRSFSPKFHPTSHGDPRSKLLLRISSNQRIGVRSFLESVVFFCPPKMEEFQNTINRFYLTMVEFDRYGVKRLAYVEAIDFFVWGIYVLLLRA